MAEPVIVATARSPIGRALKGSLVELRPDDLVAGIVVAALSKVPEVDNILRSRFGIETFSGAYGVTEASLVSWQPPGVENRSMW